MADRRRLAARRGSIPTVPPTDTDTGVVWEGAEALRQFLVPISDLEPFPGNPRTGDVDAIRASVRRFGQVRAIVVDRSGSRIVAGHHFRLAAEAEGWTHVAAIPNEFSDEDEARAYLLADNRTHDLGMGDDTALLVEHLRMLADLDALDGTGYTLDDLDGYLADLARIADADPITLPPADETPPPATPSSDLKEIVLLYSAAQREEMEQWLKIVAKDRGTNGLSETVYEAVKADALRAHQGE